MLQINFWFSSSEVNTNSSWRFSGKVQKYSLKTSFSHMIRVIFVSNFHPVWFPKTFNSDTFSISTPLLDSEISSLLLLGKNINFVFSGFDNLFASNQILSFTISLWIFLDNIFTFSPEQKKFVSSTNTTNRNNQKRHKCQWYIKEKVSTPKPNLEGPHIPSSNVQMHYQQDAHIVVYYINIWLTSVKQLPSHMYST